MKLYFLCVNYFHIRVGTFFLFHRFACFFSSFFFSTFFFSSFVFGVPHKVMVRSPVFFPLPVTLHSQFGSQCILCIFFVFDFGIAQDLSNI